LYCCLNENDTIFQKGNFEGKVLVVNSTQLKTANEMGAGYASIVPLIKNRDRVVITDDNGKSESIIISIAEYEAMKEAAWDSYVSKSLAEVEAVKDDPSTWVTLEEFWQD
jgi:PHD/YefM family antitoxin component YafN of YafNO toxin-antitoxin module